MLVWVFRDILKDAGLTRQNPENGDYSESKQPGDAGQHMQYRAHAVPEELIKTAQKICAIFLNSF